MPKMNFLRIDNSFLPHLRVSIKIYNILIIILSSIFAGLSVLTAGILPFVGIVIPQISKMISKSDYRYTFFINIFLGASFVMISDLISRIIIYPMQIPLGLVVSFILSPIFIYFLIRRGGILSDFS
jgi:iron complex transport system permease protein